MHKQVRLTVFDLHKDVWSERNVIVTYVMCCMICCILCNSKNVKKHPRRSVTFSTVAGFISPATLLKVTLLHVCFSYFLNYANDTKSCKVSHVHHGYPTVSS